MVKIIFYVYQKAHKAFHNYVLGEYDCMDYSDEQRSFNHSVCAFQPDPFNCDEHICAVAE